MHIEREKDNFESREVKRLKECALALSHSNCVPSPEKTYANRSEHCWKKNSFVQRSRTSNLDHRSNAIPTELCSQIQSTVFNLAKHMYIGSE